MKKRPLPWLFFPAIGLAAFSFALGSCDAKPDEGPGPIAGTGLSLDQAGRILEISSEFRLVPSFHPEGAIPETISWSSDNPSVASVSGGQVVAVGPGTAVIRASATAGTAECVVAVEPSRGDGTLTFLSHSGEFADNGILSDFSGRSAVSDIHYLVISSDRYPSALKSIFNGPGLKPDLFVAEAACVKEIVELGFAEDLEATPYNGTTSDQYSYSAQMGRDSAGVLRGITWQATPGGLFYRRSIAKAVFGDESPAVIQAKFATWDAVKSSGQELKTAGRFLIPGPDDLARVFFANRSAPYVNGSNVFSLDPAISALFETAKDIRVHGYDADIRQWSDAWNKEMNSTLANAKVFGYLLPTWGFFYFLAKCQESKGDWSLIQGPNPWFWGGTWIMISNRSVKAKKDMAWGLISMLCQDTTYMKAYCEKFGEFSANKTVVDALKGGYASPILGGDQHPFEYFAQQADLLDASIISPYDLAINEIITATLAEYVDGLYPTTSSALGVAVSRVKAALPELSYP
jgi:multiple sugar transport system substrate-binding protein